jgi:glycerol-3-phosphate dehydrogenase
MESPRMITEPQRPTPDLLVIGGGINGAGIARDAAGRGLSVVLCERDDLAGHTSSASSKLIHGGLRYLEHREFGLVRKALAERESLMRAAPHLIVPMRFVLPHVPSMRPAWQIRIGLWLYDHLARREWLPGSRALSFSEDTAGAALRSEFRRGFAYYDAWADDARLVVALAQDAAERGARVMTRTACIDARRDDAHWTVRLRGRDGSESTLQARAIVNATGPWAAGVGEQLLGRSMGRLRLIRGSHIVVPKLFAHDSAYLLQNDDRRVVFAIPWESDYTMIGTTDVEHDGDPGAVHASQAEVDYLIALANRFFRHTLTSADVVWRFAGVRPLLDGDAGTPAALSRDYTLALDASGAPLLSVLGGKLTTFRPLAEEAVDRIAQALGEHRAPWTADAVLPGGRMPAASGPMAGFARFVESTRARWPWLPEPLRDRLTRAYGDRIERIIDGARALPDLGVEVAPDLYEAELRYLVREEWAVDADDVLWRRTKLGMRLQPQAREAVRVWLAAHTAG